jgi:isopenicillin N synthase-like dioxygenase
MNNKYELESIDMNLSEEEIIEKLMNQLTSIGFIYIKNVEGFDEEEMLSACKAFHGIPEKEKKKLLWKNHNPNNINIYRGLSPFIDNDESHKELFDMGLPNSNISEEEKKYLLYEETPFPEGNSFYDGLKKYYREQFNHRLELGLKLASYIAIGLGKNRDYFKPLFEESLSTFRTIYYKPRSKSSVTQDLLSDESLKLTTPLHSDSGFITILSTFSFPGLQVLYQGEYISIKPEKNSFVVNLGDMLSRITNYKLKSTKHRVLDIGIERYSNPFFLDPKYSAKIPSNIFDDENKEYITYGDWLIDKMTSTYGEWKNFKKNLN